MLGDFYFMIVKTKTKVSLPAQMVDDLDKIPFSKVDKNYAIKFLDNLIRRSYRETGMMDNFVETPSKYLRKVFNFRYNSWLEQLISENIIEVDNSYSTYTTHTYSKSYSIHSKYTHSTIMWCTFEKPALKSISYVLKTEEKMGDEKKVFLNVFNDLKSLKLDRGLLYDLASKELEKVVIENYNVNEQIDRDVVNVIFKGKKKYWMKRDEAIKAATESCKVLVQDKSMFYVMHPMEFILKKKTAMFQAYMDAINKLVDGHFYGKRNSTNNRLDSNITNLAKVLTNEVCRQNNLVQIDLCNSQFAIFSYLFKDLEINEDFRVFREKAIAGTLYEYIAEEMQLENRHLAKTMMFELMFSKEDFKSERKEKLRNLFPSVVEAVDNYKRMNGYKEFSILLQKTESQIFIDGLWSRVKGKKILCLSKHDSLIVRKEDEQDVLKLVKTYFESINFIGNLLVE